MKIPELIAHRGYARHYPENTSIAIQKAIEAGANFFECDVQLTADQIPVLFHDRSLDRVCGISGKIEGIESAELSMLKAHEPDRFGKKFAGESVATLKQICDLLAKNPDVTGFIEVKRAAIEHFGVENVLEKILHVMEPVKRQTVLISFSTELLIAAHKKNWHPLGGVIEKWPERETGAVQAAQPEYLFCDAQGLPESGDLHLKQSKLVVYEIAEAAEAMQLAQRGADFIETFAVGELLKEFRSLGAKNA